MRHAVSFLKYFGAGLLMFGGVAGLGCLAVWGVVWLIGHGIAWTLAPLAVGVAAAKMAYDFVCEDMRAEP
jgi:hypothetical protein